MTEAARSYVRRKSRKSTHWNSSSDLKTPSGTLRPLRAASLRTSAGGAVPSRWTWSSALSMASEQHGRGLRLVGADADRPLERDRGLAGGGVAAGVDDRDRPVRADLRADRGDLREADARVDRVVLAPAVAA